MRHKTILIGRTYRHINRYIEILKVLIKYGFDDIILYSPLKNFVNLGEKIVFKKKNSTIFTLSRWERIRLVLEELGPTFIKFGQVLSTRPDLIPFELISELKKLQDSVVPFPQNEAIEIIEKELEKPISELFQTFYPDPIAAASLSQVHKAILKNGDIVAIKIQRPDIIGKIETDIEIMYTIASIIEKYVNELKYFNLVKIVEEFDKAIHKELDFLNEALNIEIFANNFKNDKRIYVPKVYKHLCTRKVLTMEFVEGISISKIEKYEVYNINKKLLAKIGSDIILKQIFEFRFFHADPHPGNIIILPNNIICFVDYGMMGKLSYTTIKLIISSITGIINNDISKIARNIIRICEVNDNINMKKLEYDLTELIDKYYNKPFQQINISELLNDLIKFFPENNIKMPSDLYLLVRSLIILQSVVESLDPNFNVSNEIEPYIQKFIKKEYSFKNSRKKIFSFFVELIELIRDFPYEFREITEKLKSGKIKLEVEYKGLIPVIQSFERISNRIIISIILSSIIIGSSLIIHSKLPPLWHNIPIIGLIGFFIATIIGLGLLLSIFRHGKL